MATPFYFGGFLASMTVSYWVSGNTLLHHQQTGTIQRATSPERFRVVVWVHLGLALALLGLGALRWFGVPG